MQGQCECLSENDTVKGAYEYKFLTDELLPLKNPVGENITYSTEKGYEVTPSTNASLWLKQHALGAACYGNTNLVPSFCRTYTENTERQVLAVHAAKGSTRISDWMPDSPIYQVLIQKARGAIEKVKPERVFFVWLQGESDAVIESTEDEYVERLTRLKNTLKAEVGIEKFGIIKVGYFYCTSQWHKNVSNYDDKKKCDETIMSAQERAVSEDSDFVMLTRVCTELSMKSEYINPEASGHYNNAAMEIIGAEAAKGLAAI